MTNSEKKISSRIKLLRSVWELSQDAISEIIGVPQPNWGRYEREGDEQKIPQSFLIKCSTNLFVDCNWLLFGSTNKSLCEKIKATSHRFGKRSEFAALLGVPPRFIQAIENHEISPSEEFVVKMAHALHLNKYELLAAVNPHVAAMHTTGDDRMDYDIIANDPQGLTSEQKEIIAMLKSDPGATDQVLKLLRGRKMAREAIDNLKTE